MSVDQYEGNLAIHFPWQAKQWRQLNQQLEDDRLPHALLLSGSAGVGKLRFAQAIAHYFLCTQRNAGAPCGKCRQCQLNLSVTHPDFKLIEPEEGKRQIRIDQIRELVHFLAQTSQQGGYKVTVVRPAEAMNSNAANALLKNLEEPTPNTLLILVTDAPSRLLPTIRSRCQNISFANPDREQALAWLVGIASSTDAGQLLDAAEGRPLSALQLLESGGLDRQQQMEADLLALFNRRLSSLALTEKWQEHELLDVLLWLQRKLEQLIKHSGASVELGDEWRALAVGMNPRALFDLYDQISETKKRVESGANPNHQLLLEDLLIQCGNIL